MDGACDRDRLRGRRTIGALALAGAAGVFIAMLARTIGRAALSGATRWRSCASSATIRAAGWLRPLRDAGRMPLTNYLLQTRSRATSSTAGASAAGTRQGRPRRTALAIALFVGVQLPLSTLWLRRFRAGPLEALWRRFTYG
jgi:uncharacterized membrane protein YeiB